jgi:hypothetical protein
MNYVQKGDTIACGHCMPNQGFTLTEVYGIECDCLCHRTRTEATSGTGGNFIYVKIGYDRVYAKREKQFQENPKKAYEM